MRDRLDKDTTLAELPDLINRSVQLMMDQARCFLDKFDLRAVPSEKIETALANLEQQIRPAEAQRLREAWLQLHAGNEPIQ